MLIAAVCVRVVLGGRLLTVLKILADVTEVRRPRLSLCSVMLMHPFAHLLGGDATDTVPPHPFLHLASRHHRLDVAFCAHRRPRLLPPLRHCLPPRVPRMHR